MSKRLIQLISAGARKLRVSTPTTSKVSYFCSKSNPVVGKFPKYSTNFFRELIGKRGEDEELIQALQSEISYEESNSKQHEEGDKGSLGSFLVLSDPPNSHDVVLQRSYARENIAITALLGPQLEEPGIYPRSVLMKLCITKPGEASLLRFDCGLQGHGNDPIIHKVFYHDSALSLQPSKYRGPTFSSLDYDLQDAFKEFLKVRGINDDLAKFLIVHLHNKEQRQYVQWLHYLDSIIKKGMESG